MNKAIAASFVYALVFGTITHFFAAWVGFDQQETNLIYLFLSVVIFGTIIAPAIEESIEAHNQRAEALVQKEHAELEKNLNKEDSQGK